MRIRLRARAGGRSPRRADRRGRNAGRRFGGPPRCDRPRHVNDAADDARRRKGGRCAPPGSTLCSGGSRTNQNGKPFCSVTIVAPRRAKGRAAGRIPGHWCALNVSSKTSKSPSARQIVGGLDPRREVPEIAFDAMPSPPIASRCGPRATTPTGTRACERGGHKAADRARADDPYAHQAIKL